MGEVHEQGSAFTRPKSVISITPKLKQPGIGQTLTCLAWSRSKRAMNESGYRFLWNRKPWNQRWFWCVLATLALAVHYFMGSSVAFPFFFIVPIMLAAWHGTSAFAVILAVAMSLVRFWFFFFWPSPWALPEAAINTLVRCLVLVVVALLTARVAQQQRALMQRVTALEGLLPICSFCKRIRDEHEEWKQVEVYFGTRSGAQFSHGVCPECMKQHYGIISRATSPPKPPAG